MLKNRSRLCDRSSLIVLLVMMSIAFVISMGSSVYADSEIESIEYVPVHDGCMQVIEEVDGYWLTDGESKKYFYYDIKPCAGDVLKVKYRDGKERDYSYDGDNYWRWDGKQIYLWTSFSGTQYEQHWNRGGKYAVTVEVEGVTCETTAEVVQSPVDQINFVHQGGYSYVEGQNVDSYRGNTPIYHLPSFVDGDLLTVTYNDGRGTVEYSYSKKYNEYRFRDQEGSVLSENSLRIDSDQEEHPWTPGGENSFTVSYMGKKISVPVTVTPSKVKAIQFTPKKPYTFIEGAFSDKYDMYYRTEYMRGDVLTVTYADERGTVDYVCMDTYDSFKSSDGSFIYCSDVKREMPEEENICVLGKEISIRITYGCVSTTVPVSIVENPVKEIEFQPAQPYEFWKDLSYEAMTRRYIDPEVKKGDNLTVTSPDGTKTTYVYDSDQQVFVNEKDEKDHFQGGVSLTNLQNEDWSLGEEGTVRVECGGKFCDVPATLKDNPLKEIIYNEGKPVTFIEGVDASDWEGYPKYYLRGHDPMTIVFKDGTKIPLTFVNAVDRPFYEAENVRIYEPGIPFQPYNSDQSEDNIWTAGGEGYHFTTEFAGVTATIPVNIIENPVESISFEPVRPQNLNVNADIFEGVDGFVSSRALFQEGDKLTVNRKDGSKSVYAYRLMPTEDEWGEAVQAYFFVNEKDETDVIDSLGGVLAVNQSDRRAVFMTGDQSNGEKWWEPGKHTFYVNYLNTKAPVTITVDGRKPESISYKFAKGDSFKFVENKDGSMRKLEGENYFEYDVANKKPNKGDKIIVTYTDKSTDEYVSDGNVFICDGKDARSYSLYEEQLYEPWTVGGTYDLTVVFMGKSCDAKAKVVSAEEESAQEQLEKELAAAKEAAKSALQGYRKSSDYRAAQQTELAAAISAGNKVIDAAATKAEVDQALAEAKAAIDKIKNNAQLTSEEQAKANAEAKAKADAEAKTAAEKKAAEEAQRAAAAKAEEKAKAAAKAKAKAAAEKKAKSVKSVSGNTGTVNASAIEKAIQKAGGSTKYVSSFTLGTKVSKLAPKALAKCKSVKTLVITSKKLTAKNVKNALKGSNVKTIKIKVKGTKKEKKALLKKYKKIFSKKNVGKKVNVVLA